MFYRFAKICFIIFSKMFFPLTGKGLENVPEQGGFILASNHQSNLDPFMVGILCKPHLSYLAKKSLFKNKLMAFVFKLVKAYPIERESADFRALRETLRRLKDSPVLIFPEGTRKKEERKKDVQSGIGFIAQKSQVPLIPVYIQGSDKVLPPGAKFPRHHPVTILFGQPVSYSPQDSNEEVAQRILDAIHALNPSAAAPM